MPVKEGKPKYPTKSSSLHLSNSDHKKFEIQHSGWKNHNKLMVDLLKMEKYVFPSLRFFLLCGKCGKSPLRFIKMPDHFKTKDLCEKVVRENPEVFLYIPLEFRSQEMCEYVVMEGGGHWMFPDITDEFKNQKICIYAVREDPDMFEFVPDRFKSQSMCNNVIFKNLLLIKYVPDWFLTAEMIEKYQDEEWLDTYNQGKDQKAMIKEELLPIA